MLLTMKNSSDFISIVLLSLLLFPPVSVAQRITSCPNTETRQIGSSGRVYDLCTGSDYQAPSNQIINNVPNIGNCTTLCDQTANCAKAVYDHIYSICHIKGNPSASAVAWVTSNQYSTIRIDTSIQPGASISQCVVSESSQTGASGTVFQICPNSDYYAPSFQITHMSAISDCVKLCDTTSGCAKAVWDNVNSDCHIKGNPAPSTNWVFSTRYSTIRKPNAAQGSTTSSSLSTSSTKTTSTTSTLNSAPTPVRGPIMGYNSYNDVGCSPNSASMKQAMTSMSQNGLLGAGYKYFQVDCGWQGYQRLSNGSITYDSSAFPDGIKPLSDYARSLGFKWSMYTDQGVYSCDTRFDKLRVGSFGHETQDAAMFAAWNTEYVKVDNCFIDANNNAPKNPRSDFPARYAAMWNALNVVGIPNMLVCQWGTPYINSSTNGLQGPETWTAPVSSSFRMSDDIDKGWSNVYRIYNQAIRLALQGLSGPRHIADMDLLEVGNAGMTFDEQKSHFALWATLKSSLMVSTNMPSITAQTLSILTNMDLININQDSLVAPVKLIQRFTDDRDIFLGPLANGDQVLLVVDLSNAARTISLNLADIGIASANAKDIWTGQVTNGMTSISQAVPAHGSIVLRLSGIKATSTNKPTYQYYEAESASFSGGAGPAGCSACVGGQKAGWLSSGSGIAMTINNIRTSQATSDVLFDYINCEVGYGWSAADNTRRAIITVNGGNPVTVAFPLTGYNWDTDVIRGFKVRLTGFNTQGSNSITIRAVTGGGWAPDFDRIGVST